MPIQALGYIGVDASDFDPWRRFATDVFAMQVVERGPDALALRTDERCQRVLVQRADRDGPAFFGFETAGAEALKETAGKLEAAGFKLTRASEKELTLRGVDEIAWCRDPGAIASRFITASEGEGPFTAPRRTGASAPARWAWPHGPAREDIDRMSAFYRDLLVCPVRLHGQAVSPDFLRANRATTAWGCCSRSRTGVHHVMFEVLALDDVGRAYDFALEAGASARRSGAIPTTGCCRSTRFARLAS